ncbi:unnamed protein product, partial [Urochloa humidicola]
GRANPQTLRSKSSTTLINPNPTTSKVTKFAEDDDFNKMLGSRLVYPRSASCGDGVQFR